MTEQQTAALEQLYRENARNRAVGEYPDDGTQDAIEAVLIAFGLPLICCEHEWGGRGPGRVCPVCGLWTD